MAERGDSPVDKVLATHVWGSEFRSSEPKEKPRVMGVSVIPCSWARGEWGYQRQDTPQELTGQLVWLPHYEQEDPTSNKVWGEDPHPRLSSDFRMCFVVHIQLAFTYIKVQTQIFIYLQCCYVVLAILELCGPGWSQILKILLHLKCCH